MKRKNIGNKKAVISFWGVRGSIAAPQTLQKNRYGQNTACVSIHYGNQLIVCDAGTGIHLLGNRMKKRDKRRITVLFSHLHWDHIFGLPFFTPLYQKGRNITLAGPSYQGSPFRKTFDKIMTPPFFPVTTRGFTAKVLWRDLKEGRWRAGPLTINARQVAHRGMTFGFEFSFPNGRRIFYVTDHELDVANENFARWIRGADILIHDSNYNRREYTGKKGWGHSAVEDLLLVAMKNGVKELVLFHHNPLLSDKELEKRLALCKRIAIKNKNKIRCRLAKEGEKILL